MTTHQNLVHVSQELQSLQTIVFICKIRIILDPMDYFKSPNFPPSRRLELDVLLRFFDPSHNRYGY